MIDILFSPANFTFSVALCVVFLFLCVELISTLFGVSLLSFGDGDLPDSGLLSTEFANWLNINQVPTMVWILVFTTVFSLSGFIINGLTQGLFSIPLPFRIAEVLAFCCATVITAKTVRIIARLLPSIQTSALASEDFLGSIAEVTLGRARRNSPAEAKFLDSYSQPHFVLVEPFEDDECFNKGDKVVLIRKNGSGWLATRYHPL